MSHQPRRPTHTHIPLFLLAPHERRTAEIACTVRVTHSPWVWIPPRPPSETLGGTVAARPQTHTSHYSLLIQLNSFSLFMLLKRICTLKSNTYYLKKRKHFFFPLKVSEGIWLFTVSLILSPFVGLREERMIKSSEWAKWTLDGLCWRRKCSWDWLLLHCSS